MDYFDKLKENEHEQLVFCYNKQANLKAIIAIHNTSLGPAIGGTRMWTYATTGIAVKDVLRLSKGMTYKAAIAGLNLGGGQAVIIGDAEKDKNELLFRTFGKFVDSLGGRYITAEDVGTDVRDMEYVKMETPYVTGISKALGGSGDPTPVSAYGVYIGMKACAKERWGNDSLEGKKIVVQGAGRVAKHLCEHLAGEGANLIVTDISESKLKRLAEKIDFEAVDPDEVYDVEGDIFAPTALGGILNDETIPRLKFEIVAGGANNQLEDEKKHGKMLLEKGILYAPDYVINSGGLINVANELGGYRQDRALKQAESIYYIMTNVLKLSEKLNIPTNEASNMLAEERLNKIGGMKKIFTRK